MIELKEEIKNYQPTIDLNQIEEALGEEDIQDIVDIIMQNIKKNNE